MFKSRFPETVAQVLVQLRSKDLHLNVFIALNMLLPSFGVVARNPIRILPCHSSIKRLSDQKIGKYQYQCYKARRSDKANKIVNWLLSR